MQAKRIATRVATIIGGFIFTAGIALLFGFIVRALWNWIMPDVFGLSAITYWQAWGLVLLSHILFKGMHGNGFRSRRHRDGVWHSRNKEEWEKRFKERMQRRFGGDEEKTEDTPTETSQQTPED